MAFDYSSMTSPSRIILYLASRPEANSREEYLDKMESFLVLNFNVNLRGMSLYELNQRFCLSGKALRLTPRQAVLDLSDAGRVLIETYQGKVIVFPEPRFSEWSAEMMNPDDLEFFGHLKSQLLERTLNYKK